MSDLSPQTHRIHTLFLGTSLALTCALMPTTAASAQTDTVTVGVENFKNLPFYGMCGTNYCGFARDVLDQFGRDTGMTIKYEELPILRLHRALMAGEVTYKFPSNPIFQTDLKVGTTIYYSEPVVDFLDAVISLQDGPDKIQTLGMIRGFTVDMDGFKDNGPVRVLRAKEDVELMEMLMSGKVDAIFANVLGFKYLLNESGVSPNVIKVRDGLPQFRASYHMSTVFKDMMPPFDDWLAAHKADVEALKIKHGVVLD